MLPRWATYRSSLSHLKNAEFKNVKYMDGSILAWPCGLEKQLLTTTTSWNLEYGVTSRLTTGGVTFLLIPTMSVGITRINQKYRN